MVYISLIIGHRGFGCEDKSFGGITFDIIFCMSRFNHVPPGDTLRRDAISSYLFGYILDLKGIVNVMKFICSKNSSCLCSI